MGTRLTDVILLPEAIIFGKLKMQKPQLPCQDWTSLKKVCLMVLVILAGFKGVNAQSVELNFEHIETMDSTLRELKLENDSIEFKGIILDSATNKPVAYAIVIVLDSIGGGAYSNEKGEFNLKYEKIDLIEDSLKVKVRFVGYEELEMFVKSESTNNILLRTEEFKTIYINIPHGCGSPPTLNKGLKPKPFKGFSTKFLD